LKSLGLDLIQSLFNHIIFDKDMIGH
jgi:hypothetical protein